MIFEEELSPKVCQVAMDNSSKRPEPYANQYIVECAHKREKLVTESFLAPEEKNQSRYLCDKLVVDILCRLPSSKYAFQCKCVCKDWFALISSPYFVSQFIASKLEVENTISEGSYGIVARLRQLTLNLETWKGFIMYLGVPIYDIFLSSIPQCGDLNATPPTVMGACNDLLLFCTDKLDMFKCYICNVQTRQWVQLPSPLLHPGRFALIGFICDPYYSYASKVILNAAYRYSIVVIPYTSKRASRFSAQMFSSNTGCWTEITLKMPHRLSLSGDTCGFEFRGMLYFFDTYGMFGFDPASNSDGVYDCHLIGLSVGEPFGFPTFAVCQGQLQRYVVADDGRLYIYVLKDYKTSEWSLLHNIAMQDFVVKDDCIARHRKKKKQLGYVLCQHPTMPHIFYLLAPDFIVLCNVSTRTAEVVSYISETSMIPLPQFLQFQLKLPIWPTPIPTLSP